MPLGQEVTAEDTVVALQIHDDKDTRGRIIKNWKEYSYVSNFLTPTDGWHFTVGNELLSDDIIDRLEIGRRVTLSINGHIQGDGFIDDVIGSGGRSSNEITITGRDRLAPVVDSMIDPTQYRFSDGQTLFDVLFAVFKPYGWSDPDTQYLISNEANRNIITGQSKGVPTSLGKKHKPLKSFLMHQLKPYPNEHAFAFAARLAQRHGQWIWVSSEGNSLIIATPDFDQDARHRIRHKRGVTSLPNNVEDWEVRRDASEQPTIIVATGFGGGGEFGRGGLKVAIINELTGLDEIGALRIDVINALAPHKDAKLVGRLVDLTMAGVDPNTIAPRERRYPNAPFRALFLNDDESKTIEQLENFAVREMALKQRQAFQATYHFEGHENNGQPWCVDAIADVDDDYGKVHEPLWILGRTFSKSRTSGAKTKVELIRKHTLEF